jgi:Cytidine deaminase
MTSQNKPLGVFSPFASLPEEDQHLVKSTWATAERAYIPRSNFPVGAAILAANERGETKVFTGCNVENQFFTATICAERNAATTAVNAGYRRFLKVALVCKKYPGGSPCGLCRQVIVEFAAHGEVLNTVDTDSNVRVFPAVELLPAACGEAVSFEQLSASDKRLVTDLEALSQRSYVPYSKRPRAAFFYATNSSGKTRRFRGVPDDNASYGGSELAETVAMRAARTAGFASKVTLVVTVEDPNTANPVDGKSLQVLREFGLDAKVILVGKNRSIVRSTVAELLPDSFGPDAVS